MLVLTRKKYESVIIGDNIKVQVVEIGPNQIRLGIEAPKDVSVHRQEIYEDIQAGRRPAQPPNPRIPRPVR